MDLPELVDKAQAQKSKDGEGNDIWIISLDTDKALPQYRWYPNIMGEYGATVAEAKAAVLARLQAMANNGG